LKGGQRATEGSSESEGRTATSGNVSEYLDDAGDAVAHYEYSPFGVLTAAAGTMADDFRHRFSTKAFEAAGDSALPALYYYGYRSYAPRHGRWLSRDPLGEEGGLLLYGFCGNGPLGAVDALGLEEEGIPLFGNDPQFCPWGSLDTMTADQLFMAEYYDEWNPPDLTAGVSPGGRFRIRENAPVRVAWRWLKTTWRRLRGGQETCKTAVGSAAAQSGESSCDAPSLRIYTRGTGQAEGCESPREYSKR
jgi:RHS repeat-associated protein